MSRSAWITGGSRGIGFATAELLVSQGWKVAITGRDEQAVLDAQTRLGANAMAVVADVTDRKSMANATRRILNWGGQIHALVANAGANTPRRRWGEVTPDEFERVVAANLTGAFVSIDSVLGSMRANGGGRIVVISSFAGWYVTPQPGPAYTASKAAVRGMVESLNMAEMGNAILATVVCPGEVATPIMQKRVPPPSPASLARMLQPQDVASAIAFVLEQPARVNINELVITPSWNNAYNRVPGPSPDPE
ncbi:MAG: SDR family oxidoreductase [Pseudorhodoplanes sp.]|uniref:SDR family oxidoreductase n=1 Tax=Pseudorhodoplanes sp. TaxID=1934341 RepID=UPI003D0EFF74